MPPHFFPRVADRIVFDLRKADLSGAYAPKCDLSSFNLIGANFVDSDLSGANLEHAMLVDANLTNASLDRANLGGANLKGANLAHSELSCADMSDAICHDIILCDADLSHATLIRSRLIGAKLSNSILTATNLKDANVSDADFRAAKKLTQAQLDEAIADANRAPKLDGLVDQDTGDPIVWRGGSQEPLPDLHNPGATTAVIGDYGLTIINPDGKVEHKNPEELRREYLEDD